MDVDKDSSAGTVEAPLEELQLREENFVREKRELEAEHGRQLALAKEFILGQEGKLKREKDARIKSDTEAIMMSQKLEAVRQEAEGLRTAAALSETNSRQEMGEIQKRYEEEIASLQHIMEVAASDSKDDVMVQLKAERDRWINYQQQMESQVAQLRSQLSAVSRHQQPPPPPQGYYMGSPPSSFPRHTAPVAAAGPLPNVERPQKVDQGISGSGGSDGNVGAQQQQKGGLPLEESLRWAQHNAEFMKSIVEPLEEEMTILKKKLRDVQEKCDFYEGQVASLESSGNSQGKSSFPMPLDTQKSLEMKVRDLEHYLQAEKSARTDLETFVAVLNEQKVILQEEVENLKEDIRRVCRRLELEHSSHDELKQTWEMANNQFLETQRIHETQLKQIATIIMPDQLQKLNDDLKQLIKNLKRGRNLADTEKSKRTKGKPKRETLSSNVLDVQSEALTQQSSASAAEGTALQLKPSFGTSSAAVSLAIQLQPKEASRSPSPLVYVAASSDGSKASSLLEDKQPMFSQSTVDEKKTTPLLKLNSLSHSMDALDLIGDKTLLESGTLKCRSVDGLDKVAVPSLTASVFAGNSSCMEVPLPRIQTPMLEQLRREKEVIQLELCKCRKKLEQQSELCAEYESQLQTLQRDYNVLAKASRIATAKLHRDVNKVKIQLRREQELRTQLEESSASAAQELQTRVSIHRDENQALQLLVADVQEGFKTLEKDTERQLALLGNAKAELCSQVEELTIANDHLQTEFGAAQADHGHRFALESGAKEGAEKRVAVLEGELADGRTKWKELEDTLQNQNLFLKDQVTSLQFSKDKVEEDLQNELVRAREEIADLHNVKFELEETRIERTKDRQGREQAEQSIRTIQSRSKQTILALQAELENEKKMSIELKKKIHEKAVQMENIKSQLETSESVQRDFVQLSQTLQMQLNQIQEGKK
eukprot:m.5653 g.5653  ORF g.5653 m.5653 type:complete len:939 (+) comp13730_c0_seq1:165-2981(+)